MGKVWFITGCSRGLGLILVEKVLAAGDSVIATARNPKQLDQLVAMFGSDRLQAMSLDVTDNAQVVKVVKEAMAKFKHIDVVVNNAGWAGNSPVEDTDLQSFKDQMDVNFFGVVNVTKAVLPFMRERGSGHIMQVSSIGGRVGTPGLAAYQSAKRAVNGFSTVLAAEVAPLGVKITVFEPGAMKTDWAGSSMVEGHMSEPYQQTVGQFNAYRQKLIASAILPSKHADAIVKISQVEDPPLMLLLGADTLPYAKKASDDLAASDEKWRHVSNFS